MGTTEIIGSLIIVLFAGTVHACFQLSLSTLTLMSGHAIGARTAHTKLLRLTGSFLVGTAVMTALLVSAIAFTAERILGAITPPLAWSIVSGALFTLGVGVWLFYFRRGQQGTALWVPRGIAAFLNERSKHTHSSGEAFGLGVTSVLAECLFLIGPIVVSSFALVALPHIWQLAGVALYTVSSLISLIIVGVLIGGGHGLGTIQKWRESNKQFLQFIAGGGLIVLGLYIYVERVVTSVALAGGIHG